MSEVAVNVPFDSNEIKDIVGHELRKRLDGLGPLQGAKEYASFEVSFQVTVKLRSVGNVAVPKETLAWGSVQKGPVTEDQTQELVTANSVFSSGDPNEEREARDMPLTVETTDGRGGKIRKKVNVR